MTGQRATVVRDLNTNCPDCWHELTYITMPGALSVHCPEQGCDYRRALTWRDGTITTTEEHTTMPEPDELEAITGVITLADGSTSKFTINTASGTPGWVQYGDATIERFEQTAALVDDLLAATRPHFAAPPGACNDCGRTHPAQRPEPEFDPGMDDDMDPDSWS